MPQPKISVVIPVYNMEKYLKRCMDSVINQTFKDLEIILVNDGSKDNSGSICDEYKALDKRVKVIHKQNAGLGFARNSGMEISTGEYISFVDSDDYINTDMYEKLYQRIKQENADTCIFGYQRMIGDKNEYVRTGSLSGTFSGDAAFNQIFLNTLGSEASCPDDYLILWQSSCMCLYSMDVIRRNRIIFSSERVFITEDTLFNTDYFINAKCVTILNEAFYFYCVNETSLTKTCREDRFEKDVVLYIEHLRRLKNYLPDEKKFGEARERVQRSLLANARYCVIQICDVYSFKNGRRLIADICNNPVLREVLCTYPWEKNPFKYRIFNYLLKKKYLWLLYFLTKIKK